MFKENDIAQLFLHVARVIIVTLDTSGVVTFMNQRGCEILGCKEKEVLGKNWIDDFVHQQSKDDFKSNIDSIISLGNYKVPYFECSVLARKADEIIVGWECLSVKDSAGKIVGVFCYGINITAQRQAETTLEESKEKLESIFQSASDSIIVTDLKGKITGTNKHAEEVLGINKSEMFSKFSWDFIDEADRNRAKEDWGKLAKEGYIRGLEYHFTTRNGSHIISEVNASVFRVKSGKPFGYSFVIRDITVRKRTEAQLKHNEMQFQKLFNAITEGVILIDPEGRVIKANESEARILGLKSASELKGKYFMNPNWEYISSEGIPLSVNKMSIMTAMKRKRNVRNVVTGIVKENGSTLWLNVNAVPLIDELGNVTGVVRTMTDITEQKNLRDEERQYIGEITKIQEEERKRIAHELHEETAQSLALLTLELDALSQKGENIHAEMVATLKKLREMATHTLDEVRNYSHELRPSMLDNLGLSAALEYLVEKINTRAEVKITFNSSGLSRRLPADIELALFRIAQEALNNTCKYSHANRANLSIIYTSRRVRLAITSNGSEGDVPQNVNYELVSVGMKERAKLIGATLKIKSSNGKGTVVSIEVP